MPILRLALLLPALGALAGCAGDVLPIRDGSPNPAPVPGYRVVCDTDVVGFPFWQASTDCRPVLGPVRERVVVRAKG